ncbi:MAG: HD domain-containing phosphohydrolase, partial [Bryobacteraceae bacterium]
TYRHSTGVAAASVAIARTLEMGDPEIQFIRRAALLHDIGKLGVSNSILEKPDKLTAGEWGVVKQHPAYSFDILRRIPAFEELSVVAAAHHERLDGKGYFRQWGAAQLSLPSRIIAVADVFDALSAKRPYRDGLPLETVFQIMAKDTPHGLDAQCFEALKASHGHASPASDLLALSRGVGNPAVSLPKEVPQQKSEARHKKKEVLV